jgi:ABC-type amino acid transport substrate-binding protein
MQAIDAAIDSMKKDGSMAILQKKWFGTTFEMPATPAGSVI